MNPIPTLPLSKTAKPKLVLVEFWVNNVGAVVVPEPKIWSLALTTGANEEMLGIPMATLPPLGFKESVSGVEVLVL